MPKPIQKNICYIIVLLIGYFLLHRGSNSFWKHYLALKKEHMNAGRELKK